MRRVRRSILPLLVLLSAPAAAAPQDQIGRAVVHADDATPADWPGALAGRPDGGVLAGVQAR